MSHSDPIRRLIVQQLEALRGFGVQQLGALPAVAARNEASLSVPAAPVSLSSTPTPAVNMPRDLSYSSASLEAMPRKTVPAATQSTSSLRLLPWDGPLLSRDERLDAFEKMKKEVAGCIACQQLVRNRSRTVFGDGNVTPRIVIFGEAPGADEDREGIPFVGRAGQLLTKIIEACSFKREEVYIMNVLRCRPPDNRKPEPDEVSNCRNFFERQFAVLRPEYIVCVGATPAQALLETTESIGKLRGRFHDYRGSKVVATYHPAYLLRNPDAKKFVWEDMQMMLRDMGIDPAAAARK